MSNKFLADRRNFLVAGGLGLASLNLPNLSEGKEMQKKAKSVIFIHLGGGCSQSESFVANPDSIDGYKSTTGYTSTKSGFYLGGYWDELAKISNLFSLVHSFNHTNNGHNGGQVWVNCGYNFTNEDSQSAQTNPAYGSIIAKYYGANGPTGLPNYISTSNYSGQKAAYLGNGYNPFSTSEEGRRNLGLGVEVERFNQRMLVLEQMDSKFKSGRTDKDIDAYKRQTRNILTGETSKVFDISKEPESIRELYGKEDFAQKCLLARRLVENGSKFITLSTGGFDLHTDIAKGMQNLVPKVDRAISALLSDLQSKGLLETTLVIITTEFGRTKLNPQNGKDHNSRSIPLLIAGSKYSQGNIIGTATKNSDEFKDKPFYPIDLLYTIFQHMEMPSNLQYQDFAGRPKYMLSQDAKLII